MVADMEAEDDSHIEGEEAGSVVAEAMAEKDVVLAEDVVKDVVAG